MKSIRLTAAALAASLLVVACGGGGGGSDEPPVKRGDILLSQFPATVPAATIDAGTAASGAQALTGPAKCGVDIRYVAYATLDPKGALSSATAGVMVPNGSDAACQGPRPVVLYGHGTTTTKSYNMADVANNKEGALLMAMFAAQGYIVVAPNYLGYDRSGLDYHPYLNAESSAIDMVDGLRAALTLLKSESAVKPSAKLFLSGYSQGGHVAMATQRAIQRDYASEFTVTASAPLSGPYSLLNFVTRIVSEPNNNNVSAGATLFTPLLLTSWQRSYGDIWGVPSDAYQAAYAGSAATLLPTDTSVEQLLMTGQLPADPTFRLLFGTGGLLNESYRAQFNVANNGFKAAATRNTVLDWKPASPMALCYSSLDPTVFGFNTTDAQAYFALQQGVLVPALNLRDVAGAAPLGVGAQTLAGAFGLTFDATNIVTVGSEHSNAAPFCAAFARGFFSNFGS